MKILTGCIFLLLLGLIGVQLYRLNDQRVALVSKAHELEKEAAQLKAENEKVKADVSFFSNPQNLTKEFLEILPFKLPGQERYIIVPKSP